MTKIIPLVVIPESEWVVSLRELLSTSEDIKNALPHLCELYCEHYNRLFSGRPDNPCVRNMIGGFKRDFNRIVTSYFKEDFNIGRYVPSLEER